MSRRERERASGQVGFTLIELMVVVAIVGIMVTAAVVNMSRGPTVEDQCRAIAARLREASRKAVAGGAVRDNVATATLQTARTRTRIFRDGTTGLQTVVVERVAEDPILPDFEWEELSRLGIDERIEIFGTSPAAEIDPGVTPVPLIGEHTISCFPNGACEPMTLYLRSTGAQKKYGRVVVMPLNGSPLVFNQW
jgi:prepilin-type N-terminal cleavage/methylation domain-containing protein